jgi:hypothetical protein
MQHSFNFFGVSVTVALLVTGWNMMVDVAK